MSRWLLIGLLAWAGCGAGASADVRGKTLRIPMATDGPKTLDPVRGSTTYESRICGQVYDTLVQYKYLVRPPALEPLLLAQMPTISEDRRTYRFRLKEGVRFRDDPCFPGGKGRAVRSNDVFYSWKRMADKGNNPKSWWLIEDTIKGFDEYRETQNAAAAAGGRFDYDAPVEGMRILNDLEFEVELKEPVQRLLYVLAMFQLSIVPREAVEKYGDRFGAHPVGTGPFLLREESDWVRGKSILLHRNPNYMEEKYPAECGEEDRDAGLADAAGKKLPIVDRVEVTFYIEPQPRWLEFRAGLLDFTIVPADNFTDAFIKRTRRLRREWRERGYDAHAVPQLDFIFRGFNMTDGLVGGYSEKKKALRRAIHLAMDLEEFNDAFYNSICVVYDGPIPPDLDGHPEKHRLPYGNQGPDLARAREELAKAGYPDGEGLPAIDFYTGQGGSSKEQTEMMQRQLQRIGVDLNIHLVDFSQLIEAVNNRKAPMFSFAWNSDYPDGENNLAIFYGPNQTPGSNSFNYENDEFDALYRKIRAMQPSPERTAIYCKMRDMLIEDVPYIGSLARTNYYLVHPRVKNCKPTEVFGNWWKYLDVED
jgi:ABC-type transport system substrate-binding protein